MVGYYLFALFVFFLLAVLVLFARLIFASRRKPEELVQKEEKLLRLYSQIEDMMESFEDYAEEVRESIAVQRNNMLRDMNALKDEITGIAAEKKEELETPVFREYKKEPNIRPVPEKKQVTEESIKQETMEAIMHQSKSAATDENKNEKIMRLYGSGMSESEISKEMNMTMSEVKLIIQVNKR